ncbi:transposase [Corynebacterium diphtheriae]|uniref:transposase n=1 Tax=Corynebacterium diphtheriae TaxID=1717 RepID=UPI001F516958|nr:transposase [Corynebacterium diphtheriae]
MVRTYSPAFREAAVRMMIKHQKEHHCSRWASTVAVSQQVGVSPNSIWNWYKKGALEAEEVHEFDVAYYQGADRALRGKGEALGKDDQLFKNDYCDPF